MPASPHGDTDKATTSATEDRRGFPPPCRCRVTARYGDKDLAFVILLLARGMGCNESRKVGGREDMPLLEAFKHGSTEVVVCRVQQVNDQILNGRQSEIVIVGHQERRVREV